MRKKRSLLCFPSIITLPWTFCPWMRRTDCSKPAKSPLERSTRARRVAESQLHVTSLCSYRQKRNIVFYSTAHRSCTCRSSVRRASALNLGSSSPLLWSDWKSSLTFWEMCLFAVLPSIKLEDRYQFHLSASTTDRSRTWSDQLRTKAGELRLAASIVKKTHI